MVKRAFSKFLRKECGEEMLLFWFDCNELAEKFSADLPNARLEALKIYNNYIKHMSPMEVHVDAITRETLGDELQINAAHTEVKCNDAKKICEAFVLPREKVFQVLKFEFMPRFLTSSEFQGLESFNEHFGGDSHDVAHTASSMGDDMNLDYILFYHPMGMVYFKSFLYGNKDLTVDPHVGDELYELLLEIDDFHSSKDPKHRAARAERIINRFAGESPGVKILQDLAAEIQAKPRLLRDPPADMFETTRAATHDKLESMFYKPFQNSSWFTGLKENVSLVFTPGEKPSRIGRTGSLVNYAKERELERKQKEMDEKLDVKLLDILHDNLGLFYFKKFCRTNFMEECILFWLEVTHFQEGDVSAPAHGTAIFGAGSSADLIMIRRQKIIDKYINPGSRMEVNIPTAMRERIYQAAKEADTPIKANNKLDIFDEAQRENFKLLQENLWAKFQKSKLFKM